MWIFAVFILALAVAAVEDWNGWTDFPDTGFDAFLSASQLPSLDDVHTLPDFEAVASHVMSVANFSFYRTAAAGEFSYRHMLDVFQEVKLRPRVLRNVANRSMDTDILGFHSSAPFFISPASHGILAHPRAELNLVDGAHHGDIIYAVSLSSSLQMEEIAAQAAPGQVLFHQLYVSANKTKYASDLSRIENSGYKAIFVTVDDAIHGIRTRESRYGWPNTTDQDPAFDWQAYADLRNRTKLPVVPKGIQTVEDAQMAVKMGAPAIYVSNHGSRQLDTSQTPLEVVLEIHTHAPEIFDQIQVFADGGVRYGTDVIKLLALGVRAVGLGRPFMFSNVFGADGVSHAVDMLKNEIMVDMADIGVTNPSQLDTSYLNLKRLERFVYGT